MCTCVQPQSACSRERWVRCKLTIRRYIWSNQDQHGPVSGSTRHWHFWCPQETVSSSSFPVPPVQISTLFGHKTFLCDISPMTKLRLIYFYHSWQFDKAYVLDSVLHEQIAAETPPVNCGAAILNCWICSTLPQRIAVSIVADEVYDIRYV